MAKYSDNVVSANLHFCRIPRLWNVLPIIDLSLSIKCKLYTFLWNYFLNNFDPNNNNCTLHFLCPCRNCSKLPRSINVSMQA